MTVNSLNQVRPTQSLRGHVDVLIVGAGISGLGMGHYLATMQPGKSFAIVDSRDAIGGAPGTCSAIRASGRIPTCTPSATSSSRGRLTTRSPTPTRSSTTCTRWWTRTTWAAESICITRC